MATKDQIRIKYICVSELILRTLSDILPNLVMRFKKEIDIRNAAFAGVKQPMNKVAICCDVVICQPHRVKEEGWSC